MPGGTHGETHASDASRKKREGAPSHLPTKHHAFLVQQISQPRLSWLATALIAGAGTGLAAAGLAACETDLTGELHLHLTWNLWMIDL
jgi:hypothetical protein